MAQIFFIVQFFFAIVIGLYFLSLLKNQTGSKTAVDKESKKEMVKLQKMREIALSEPLSEKTRPSRLQEVVGQVEGIKALKAALCSPNPQHVIIYGPPGVGKTAAARLVLEEAKKSDNSPFKEQSKFVEMDATILRFDERGIADPLMGSVHDPIYQGAGAMGVAGIPQPKPGAVTKAHGGILFIDEIGELHPVQMNKLLKVLEDRKVFLESSYYNSEDNSIPDHIHDIFKNGLPADFRLIGATTKTSQEICPALRSRCVEVYFRPLMSEEVKLIVKNAVEKSGFEMDEKTMELISQYASNGREAVNIIQISGGLALTEGRKDIKHEDVEWVINNGQYAPRPDKRVKGTPQIGYVNGLALYGPSVGTIIEVEATATKSVVKNGGKIIVTGIVEEERTSSPNKSFKRKSNARGSVDNVLTVIKKYINIDPGDYDIHLNFPGGIPIDGPSAGIAIATAIYSAITNKPIDGNIAMTGELSIRGEIKAIGGVVAKIEAAKQAGCTRVIIPKSNWQNNFQKIEGIRVLKVETIDEVIDYSIECPDKIDISDQPLLHTSLLSADGMDKTQS